ncbi:galactan 5-O-arabinofuranosyltransferase [Saccharopolyspora antimicrobica]|uniref:Galactan 5-O-arabinofuranosyltransferase n=2 Tax=Saccharopolyspora antimicrobica TaxID=455193 RepID=A0A1I4V503_9PSEU|nr:galactan 5-O-arabinofuranosyltransferase [Saccharopolyspora antimicrobica]SFM96241.1 galactan 5-O-arabinofuranosyltransferase [Saccharopolyspora antimicrobica]
MAGILPSMKLTGPSPIDEPRRDSAVRLPLRNTVAELLLGTVVAVVVSMLLQFAAARLSISEPSFAPEALAAVGSGVVLAVLFLALALGHRRSPRWLRLFGSWVSLSAFSTLALAIPLQATRFYYGGSSVDNGFRMQYMTRMASTPGLADMNYADTPPYYPGGWFWLGGRFANLLGWEGWAAYKPYALTWVAVSTVVAFTLWSVVVRRRIALLAAIATALAGMLHGVEEPYAWPSAAWLAPVAVLAWHALRRRGDAPRWTLVCIGVYVGFASITYTLHFGFAVLMIVTMAVLIGAFRVHQGQRLWPTVRQLFLRLLPIGLVSLVIALVGWLPYLLATSFLLNNPRSVALHYLPEDGAFLPVPMMQGTAFGVLCLAGLVWLLVRCRRNEVAASMLTIVIAVYCWFVLSTLALIAKTTLLAFRLNVILDVVLAVAGVFGLLELIGYLRRRFDARHALQISMVACALGMLGAITINQGAIGVALQDSVKAAYQDYYPTGDNAMGQRDPDELGSWTDEEVRAVAELTGRAPEQNLLLSTDYKLMSFKPYWGFQQETPHYANPLGDYDERAAEIHRWASARTSEEFLGMLRGSEFRTPNVFILSNPASPHSDVELPEGEEGKLVLQLKGDAFPQLPNVRDYDVYFDPAVFDSPEFVQREVGPYTVIARR